MLLKELLEVLVKMNCYTIRIDTYDVHSHMTVKENIYRMKEIPIKYHNLEILTIHTSDAYDSNLYQYFITVYK